MATLNTAQRKAVTFGGFHGGFGQIGSKALRGQNLDGSDSLPRHPFRDMGAAAYPSKSHAIVMPPPAC